VFCARSSCYCPILITLLTPCALPSVLYRIKRYKKPFGAHHHHWQRKRAAPPPLQDAGAVLSIGPGLPPVARIQAGEFIDMAELLPDCLGISTTPSKDDKQATKQKRRQVTNILEWTQCFSIYVAVLTQKHTDRIQDLLGYQALIVETCMEYNSEAWLGYDRRFRQNAAATPGGTIWATMDPTLWNKAFTGQAHAQRCQYCFSLTHKNLATATRPTPPHPHREPSQ
jgi:hypothetical protein